MAANSEEAEFMVMNLREPEDHELRARITVFGRVKNSLKADGCIHAAVFCIALGAAVSAASLATTALAQSLPDTLVTAYLNSPELAAARADVNVLSERAVQARAGGRLRVEGELSLRHRRFTPIASSPSDFIRTIRLDEATRGHRL